jgi:aspartyl-tRNA(Asn)/glutamyl-tRNA(Gln) amidotransferase subunit A
VAVAAGIVPAALGTDTGGSVRIPASLCGIVGLKPTRGRLPLDGVVPLAPSLDHVGVLTRTVQDAAELLAILSDPPSPELAAGGRPPAARVLGVLVGFAEEAEPEVGARFAEALATLERTGCTLRPVPLPRLRDAVRLLAAILFPEAGSAHRAILDPPSAACGAGVQRDFGRGLAADPQRRTEALRAAGELTARLRPSHWGCDLLVSPTTPAPAAPIGAPGAHRLLACTCPFNLGGMPAISVPMGLAQGLPVGLQIAAAAGDDDAVLALAAAYEQATGPWPEPPRCG